jgi:hypothetical protein
MTEGQRFALNKAIAAVVGVAIVGSFFGLLKWHGVEQRKAGFNECYEQFLTEGHVVATHHEAVLVPLDRSYAVRLWTRPMVSGGMRAELWRKGEFRAWAVLNFEADPEFVPRAE